jgi:hypothetical protein
MMDVESAFNVSLAMNSYATLECGQGRFLEEQSYLININSGEMLTQYTGNDLTLFLLLRQ